MREINYFAGGTIQNDVDTCHYLFKQKKNSF
jgi:hypothetical protein